MRVFYIFLMSLDAFFVNIFLRVRGLSFHFLNSVFEEQKLLFVESNLGCFYFVVGAFSSYEYFV